MWLIGDTHLGHSNIIKYCNRPFQTVEEMNDTIIENWNTRVGKNDLVYHLGDFALTKKRGMIKKFRDRLDGRIILIRGNHDKLRKEDFELFERVEKLLDIKYAGKKITLGHYSMRTWNCSYHGSYHFFAHSHGKLEPYGRSHDVGVDVNGFKPISIDEGVKKCEENFEIFKKHNGKIL